MVTPESAPGVQGVVWIIDDGADEAEIARKALCSCFATRIFDDGQQMLTQLAALPAGPDVLVVDWMMPGISGIEICKILRAAEATAELPILLLTAQNKTQQIVEGLDAGANDYVSRPYAPAELLARVSSLVRFKLLHQRTDATQRSLRALLAHLPDALIATDAEGKVTFLNAEAERILAGQNLIALGHPLESFPGLATVHELQLDGESFAPLAEFGIGDRLYAPAARRLALDGVLMIAVTLRDVTEKRRVATRRLDFYSMVAHDLRSPLLGMTLRLAQMKEEQHGPLPAAFRKDVEAVDFRIGELVKLIGDFLDIARSEGVGFALARQTVDLTALVQSSLPGFSELAGMREVKLRFDAQTPSVYTLADPARLKQVMTNLVSNAVKFSSKGGEVLLEVGERNGEAEFAVSDAGRGVAEEHVSELFKRYSRQTRDPSMPGTGLGLLIVREIVAAHSGTCGVDSTLGKGSRFWFRLPLGATPRAHA